MLTRDQMIDMLVLGRLNTPDLDILDQGCCSFPFDPCGSILLWLLTDPNTGGMAVRRFRDDAKFRLNLARQYTLTYEAISDDRDRKEYWYDMIEACRTLARVNLYAAWVAKQYVDHRTNR